MNYRKLSPLVITLSVLGLLGLLITPSVAISQTPPTPAAAPAVATPPAEPPAYPKFEDCTKGMEAHKGLFTLWYYPESVKDKETEKLLCQIPASFLGQKFMLSISESGGGCFPIDEHVVQWQQHEKQLLLVEPQAQYVVDEKNTIYDAVKRTHTDRILAALPIATRSPEGDPMVDLGPLLKSSFAGIGGWSIFGMPRGGGVNAGLSKWTKRKTFELNVEISVELAVSRSYPQGSYEKQIVHYSFWKLPASDYKPRVADDRVGYFLTAQEDWAKPTDSRDLFNRYIDRWSLVKRDPSLTRCDPKEPIVFYIEKTVPIKFRRAVRDGILEWNKAFDAIGFVDAVQVRQQTEDNEWKDLDPEDMRYSFFRWIVTGAGFAMGPHRANPFTGQIYDADIVFDDSFVRYAAEEGRDYLPSALVEMKLSDPGVKQFVAKYPQWMQPTVGWSDFLTTVRPAADEQQKRVVSPEAAHGRCAECCDYARGMQHQMVVAKALLANEPPEVMERLTYDLLKEVVMHEVGHTLGLRHNFKASSIYSLDEIRARRTNGQATTGSVMDYNSVLYTKNNPSEGFFVTPTLGPWDYWAIEYGYRPADGKYQQPAKSVPQTQPGVTVASVAPTDCSAVVSADVMNQLPPHIRKVVETAVQNDAVKPAPAPTTPAPATAKPAETQPKPPADEAGMLKAIASRSTEAELAYGTDEDCTMMSPDPRVNRYDVGADPIAWATDRMDLVNARMKDVLSWSVKDGESWYFARQSFMHLLAEKAFVLDYVGRYIGGQYMNRAHRGDPDFKPPFEMVDTDTQLKAMQFIENSLFKDDFFVFDAKVLNHLTSPRWYHNGAYVSYTIDLPIHRMVSMLQWWNLFDRLFPNTLRRIQDAELKTSDGTKLTAAEYIRRVQDACWADSLDAQKLAGGTWSDEKPFISDVRRSLHREYLDIVETLVRARPGTMLSQDLHAMMQQSIRDLAERMELLSSRANGKIDFASQAHLAACKSRIDRILKPELREQEFGYNMMGGMYDAQNSGTAIGGSLRGNE